MNGEREARVSVARTSSIGWLKSQSCSHRFALRSSGNRPDGLIFNGSQQ